MYIDEGELHPNLIKKFKLKLNLIITEPKLEPEPEPCDLAFKRQNLAKKRGEAVKYYKYRTTTLRLEMGIALNKMEKPSSWISGKHSRI